jgi:hypothetical protein
MGECILTHNLLDATKETQIAEPILIFEFCSDFH